MHPTTLSSFSLPSSFSFSFSKLPNKALVDEYHLSLSGQSLGSIRFKSHEHATDYRKHAHAAMPIPFSSSSSCFSSLYFTYSQSSCSQLRGPSIIFVSHFFFFGLVSGVTSIRILSWSHRAAFVLVLKFIYIFSQLWTTPHLKR